MARKKVKATAEGINQESTDTQHIKKRSMQSWRPNFRRASAYNRLIGRAFPQIGWEFMRRSPIYQADYDSIYSLSLAEGVESPRLHQLYEAARKKHWLKFVPDPAVDEPEDLLPDPGYFAHVLSYTDWRNYPFEPGGHHHVMALIDLRIPVREIMDILEGKMNEIRKLYKQGGLVDVSEKKFEPHKLVMYLRLLDALNEGANKNEIASTLGLSRAYNESGSTQFQVAKLAAERIRDQDYKYLYARSGILRKQR